MAFNLNSFTSRTDILLTDELAGKRGSLPGAESRWTYGVIKLWVEELIAADLADGVVTSVAGKTGIVELEKADVGLGNVDNTTDAAKPISTATAAALALKAASVHTHGASDISDSTAVGRALLTAANLAAQKAALAYVKGDVGLGSVDNTSDAAKPISTAAQTALDLKAAVIHTHAASAISDSSSIGRTILTAADLAAVKTALAYAKADVGLGNVDNTSDANKPVSTATQTALNQKANTLALDDYVELADFASHVAQQNNPHVVTKAQVGLGNVDNTADADKPVSTATTTALAGKANTVHSQSATSITSGQLNPARLAPDGEALQVLRRNATNDMLEWADPSGGGGGGSGDLLAANNLSDVSDTSIARSNLGLGNVTNTSDANKPVSTAQQTALDLKADDSDLTTHTGDTTNPHAVTKAQVGLTNVTNDAQTKAAVVPNTAPAAGQVMVGNLGGTAYEPQTVSGDLSISADGSAQIASNAINDAKIAGNAAIDINKLGTNVLARANHTGSQAVSTVTGLQDALDAKAASSALTTHTSDTANPHAVTKTQVGLSNVPNTNFEATLNVAQVSETPTSVAPSSGVVTVNLALGTVFLVNLNANVTSFTISNPIASRVNSFTLILTQDATGSRTVAWTFTGKTLKWPSATAPTITPTLNKADVITFVSPDGGTTFYGFVGGQVF